MSETFLMKNIFIDFPTLTNLLATGRILDLIVLGVLELLRRVLLALPILGAFDTSDLPT